MTVSSAMCQPALSSTPVDRCDICGSEGSVLFSDLHDVMGNVAGEFGIRQCNNPLCRCLWQDPRPTEADIHLAYRTYYTHGATSSTPRPAWAAEGLVRRVGKGMHQIWQTALTLRSQQAAVYSMYLMNVTPGRLLDVGCGNGHRLQWMREHGWDVQGQEVDPVSAEQARSRGIPVFLGELEDAAFPDNSFDAIVASHVIEHLYRPIEFLRQCHRLLKPNGVFVAVTPNVSSLGLRTFGRDWRDLDPPRHIRLFTQAVLSRIAGEAGFLDIQTWTTPARAEGVALSSYRIRQTRISTGSAGIMQELRLHWMAMNFQLRAMIAMRKDPCSGEECVLWIRK